MARKKSDDAQLREVLRVLSGLRGVRQAFYLTMPMREGLERMERICPSFGPLVVNNEGVLACMKREHVACIIKDRTFRLPPKPTVLLIDSDGHVIGHELLPGTKPRKGQERAIFIGKDFVVYFEKGKGKGAKFVLPEVPFAEVEELAGVKNVVSSSPSTSGDFFLKREAGLDDDPRLASILIGFDVC